MKPKCGSETDPMKCFRDIRETIDDICESSGTAGASVGVLHWGKTLYKTSHGFRDVQNNTVPDCQTLYGIGSLTKALVAFGIEKLVERGKIEWTTRIKDIIPEWRNVDPTVTKLTTIVDCLAHRTGILGDISLTFQGDGDCLLPKDQLIPTLNRMRPTRSFREKFTYSSWGYAIMMIVIEKITGSTLDDFLRATIFEPLGMSATTTRPRFPKGANVAEPYAALDDGKPFRLRSRMDFKDTLFEAAAGAFANVDDMLLWSKALLDVSNDSKQLLAIFKSQIPVHPPTFRECSYAMGWMRTQLPGVVGILGDNIGIMPLHELPVLGQNSPSMLTLYHQGSTPGYYSSIFLFPETKSAVIVLTNSMSLCDAADFIGQAYTQALFDFNGTIDYASFARTGAQNLIDRYKELQDSIKRSRRLHTHRHPLKMYTGRYWNALRNFRLEIRLDQTSHSCLQVAFQGLESQVYDLRPLHNEIFEWSLPLNEVAKRGRYHMWDADFYKFEFCTSRVGKVQAVRWIRDPENFPRGEKFRKGARHFSR